MMNLANIGELLQQFLYASYNTIVNAVSALGQWITEKLPFVEQLMNVSITILKVKYSIRIIGLAMIIPALIIFIVMLNVKKLKKNIKERRKR